MTSSLEPGSERAVADPPGSASRPLGLWLLTVFLLASPAIHAAALLTGRHWLNFGSLRAWDGFVYFAIAPLVGVLMFRRHERARFSVYVFLSCEILRAVRIESAALGLLAAGALVYLQLPAPRRFHPSVDPRRVLSRLGIGGRDTQGAARRNRDSALDGGAASQKTQPSQTDAHGIASRTP